MKHSRQSGTGSSAGVKGRFVSGVSWLLLGFNCPVNGIWSPQDDGRGEIIQFLLALANIFCQQVVNHRLAEQIVSQLPCQTYNVDAGGQLKTIHG